MAVSGPFFSPNVDSMVRHGINDMQRAVARKADERVEALHRKFFKRPRPFYWMSVTAHPRGNDWVVTDEGSVVYNHWLEGTGSRNYPRTRFKGYRSFRIATREIARRIRPITRPVVKDLCRRLNGR